MTVPSNDMTVARNGRTFHLFVHGVVPEVLVAASRDGGAGRVAVREVVGTEYDVDGGDTALVLAGPGRVQGEVWRCAVELLPELDRDERVASRHLRRVGVQVGEFACWAYVAGPKLAPQLAPGRRLE